MMKRALVKLTSVGLALTMLFSLLTVTAAAEGDGWWKEEVWETETLTSLGAKPPYYNKEADCYEISTPEQLLYLSGAWKSDAPRNGHYVLTADLDMGALMDRIGKALTAASGEETAGYMPPISANKDENEDKTDGWFLGEIDGRYHTISNLRICRSDGKYTALVGYLGSETQSASIRNLGLLDITIKGKKTCGAFAGTAFGTIENCFATGSVKGKETVGGLVGKCEGVLKNCVSYLDVEAKELVGGLIGSTEVGGAVENCYVGGSVTAADGNVMAGGVSGAFSMADSIKNVVCVSRAIQAEAGAVEADRLIGSLASESGVNLTDNYVWEGMILGGNAGAEHPNRVVAQEASSAKLMGKVLYEKTLGWDFAKLWSWVGSSSNGYPMLKGFVSAENGPDLLETVTADLTVKTPVLLLDNPVVNFAEKGKQPEITARVVLPNGVTPTEVTVHYGTDSDGSAFTQTVSMTATGNASFRAVLPIQAAGIYYYYVSADVAGEPLTFPADIHQALRLELDDGVADPTPREILCQVGETYGEIGLNWTTEPTVEDSKVWYRMQGTSDWSVVSGESALHYLTEGWEELQSHWATITGLAAKTTYEYAVGGTYAGKEVRSEVHTFTTLPASGAFTFMQYGDLQADSPEGYDPFLKTMDQFVGKLPTQPDFLLNTGDIVDAGYKSAQWASFFDVAGSHMADRLNILLPGNHENAGDLLYKQYGAMTSLPNESEYGPLEGTGWCVIGDACFVFLNADPYSGKEGADVDADRARFFVEQAAWAKDVYEKADCTWRIMAAHMGTYIVNYNDVSEYPYIPELCDALDVDLYLNGHDHEYIRTTVKDNAVKDLGQGTTYMTCSSLGEKLDAFEPNTAGGKVAVVHHDGADESQQIFSMVTVDAGGIHVTAYQRGVEEDWSQFSVIDRFDISTSLTKGAQKQPEVVTPPATVPVTVPVTPPVKDAPSAGTYVVEPGDCLYRIAQKLYGNGSQWTRLYEANRGIIKDPARIYIGQVLTVPAA